MFKIGRSGFLVASIFLFSTASATRASTLAFSFSGTAYGGGRGVSTGTGRFTFPDLPADISLQNLTSFSFTQTTGYGFPPGPCTYNYGLGDLTSFSLSLASGRPTAFSLGTDFAPGTNPATGYVCLSDSFTVTGLGAREAFTSEAGEISMIGKVSFSPTPEPASLGLVTIALLSIGLAAVSPLRSR